MMLSDDGNYYSIDIKSGLIIFKSSRVEDVENGIEDYSRFLFNLTFDFRILNSIQHFF